RMCWFAIDRSEEIEDVCLIKADATLPIADDILQILASFLINLDAQLLCVRTRDRRDHSL
ncbi:MAG TPA: hypothetical protein VJ206_00255, partial [bacterium]|nr:hypothetical protein [bacterium]